MVLSILVRDKQIPMKRIYLSFALALISAFAYAQPYLPMLDSINRWTYSSTIIPVSQQNRTSGVCLGFGLTSTIQSTTIDTLINGLTYKKVYVGDFMQPFVCFQGFIREDTAGRKIYFMEPNFAPERLIYDFGMLPGDSIYVNGGGAFDYFAAGYYTLISITTYQTIAGPTRAFTLMPSGSPININPLVWLEGIGYPGELIYDLPSMDFNFGIFFPCNGTAPWYDYLKILTCFEHENKSYFDSCTYNYVVTNTCFNVNDSCNYFNICGSLEELKSISNIRFHPNPATSYTNMEIQASKTENITISVLDINGRELDLSFTACLTKGLNNLKLNLERLSPGFYLIKSYNRNGALYSRLIKQ
jgi:hypothetical protein